MRCTCVVRRLLSWRSRGQWSVSPLARAAAAAPGWWRGWLGGGTGSCLRVWRVVGSWRSLSLSEWRAARRGYVHPGLLTKEIKNCREAAVLLRILHEQRGALDHIQVAAAWACLAMIGREEGSRVDLEVRLLRMILDREVNKYVVPIYGDLIGRVLHSPFT